MHDFWTLLFGAFSLRLPVDFCGFSTTAVKKEEVLKPRLRIMIITSEALAAKATVAVNTVDDDRIS